VDKKENSPSARRGYSHKNVLQIKQNLTQFFPFCKKNEKKFFCSNWKHSETSESSTFCDSLRLNKHFQINLQTWGTKKSALPELERQGCKLVRLIEKESGLVYEAPLELILSRGVEKDLGFGVQVFLPEKEWEVKDPGQLALFKERKWEY